MDKSIKKYKVFYNIAWIITVLFFIPMPIMLLAVGAKNLGILLFYYLPTWLPVITLSVLTIIFAGKKINHEEDLS